MLREELDVMEYAVTMETIELDNIESEEAMEVKERIEQLENQIFLIWMVDRWTNEDRKLLEKAEKELKELKERRFN